ncbi:hypothetical protein BDC45DRAFT_508485 [Circinella umbellata]|nr:hypothetical protein BDC45DRAFT_508485 [Circinella umbellata]
MNCRLKRMKFYKANEATLFLDNLTVVIVMVALPRYKRISVRPRSRTLAKTVKRVKQVATDIYLAIIAVNDQNHANTLLEFLHLYDRHPHQLTIRCQHLQNN